MYNIGDLIIYGSEGLCRVEAVGALDKCIIDSDMLYYTLCPIYHEGKIYTPVDTAVFMRPIITCENAQHLIDCIPQIQINPYNNQDLKLIERQYKSLLKTYNCEDLVQMIKSITAKKNIAVEQGKKLGQTDERYMKNAEDLLYGEFAFALGICRENVKSYIEDRVCKLESTNAM